MSQESNSPNPSAASEPEIRVSRAPVWELTASAESQENSEADPDAKQFLSYVRMLFVPTIFTKTLIMFFGLNYAMYPGEGYGYGLASAICLSVFTFSYFVWSQSRKKPADKK